MMEEEVPTGQGINQDLGSKATIGGQAIQGWLAGLAACCLGPRLATTAVWGGGLTAQAAAAGLGLQRTGGGWTFWVYSLHRRLIPAHCLHSLDLHMVEFLSHSTDRLWVPARCLHFLSSSHSAVLFTFHWVKGNIKGNSTSVAFGVLLCQAASSAR